MKQRNQELTLAHPYYILSIIAFMLLLDFALRIYLPDIYTLRHNLIPIIGMGSIFVLLITIINFRLSIILFIFVAPLVNYYVPSFPFYFTPSDAYIIVLVVVYVVRLAIGRESGLRKTFLDRTIFLLLLWLLLSSVNTDSLFKSMKEFVKWVEFFIFAYYLFASVIRTRNMLNIVIHTIALVSGLVSLQGIYQYLSSGDTGMRIYSTFGHFNALGAFLAMTTTLIFNLIVTENSRRTKLLYSMFLGLNVVGLLLTFSRGAWIGCIVGIVISAQIRGMVNFIKYFSVLIVFMIIFSLFAPERYLGRVASIPKISDEASTTRIEQYNVAMNTIMAYPILGVGLGNMPRYVTDVYDEPTYGEIHNIFLHVGSESGLPAMLLVLWIFISFYIHIIRTISRTEDHYYYSLYIALFSSIVAFGIVNMFAYMFVRGPIIFFVMFLGIYQAALFVEENEPRDTEWVNLLSSVDMNRPTMRMDL